MKPAMNGHNGITFSPRARIVERRPRQSAAQAQALVGLVDFGEHEGDPPAAQAVLSVACQLAVRPNLLIQATGFAVGVAFFVGLFMLFLWLGRRCRSGR